LKPLQVNSKPVLHRPVETTIEFRKDLGAQMVRLRGPGIEFHRAQGLYSSIQFIEEELIEEVDIHEEATLGDERRRYYWLTSAGRKLARSEAERLADLLRAARVKKI
jgi:hypothetical protein